MVANFLISIWLFEQNNKKIWEKTNSWKKKLSMESLMEEFKSVVLENSDFKNRLINKY